METAKIYELPKLEYDYDELAPVISEDLLRRHHDKYHAIYVNGANTILEMMNKSWEDRADFDTKATFKELSFHVGGPLLLWENLASRPGTEVENRPGRSSRSLMRNLAPSNA